MIALKELGWARRENPVVDATSMWDEGDRLSKGTNIYDRVIHPAEALPDLNPRN